MRTSSIHPNLSHTAPDLSRLFDMPLPPPPPLSSSGLLRPFVPIVPVAVLLTRGIAARPAAEPTPSRRWWLLALAGVAAAVGALAASRFVPTAAPIRTPHEVEILGATVSYEMDLAAALATAGPPRAAPPPAPVAVPAAPHAVAAADLSPIGVAKAALERGDLSRASFAYAEATGIPELRLEGFVGLGDIARRKGDPAAAAGRYRSALGLAPRYFPALLGLADATWESGDHAGARAQYLALRREYSRHLPGYAVQRMK